jgi:hypothetical protein
MADDTQKESSTSKWLGKLKEATNVVVDKTREGVEDLQQKRELSATYDELGKKAAELVDSGAISHPDLTPLVDKVNELKAALAAQPEAEAEEAPVAAEPGPEEPGPAEGTS